MSTNQTFEPLLDAALDAGAEAWCESRADIITAATQPCRYALCVAIGLVRDNCPSARLKEMRFHLRRDLVNVGRDLDILRRRAEGDWILKGKIANHETLFYLATGINPPEPQTALPATPAPRLASPVLPTPPDASAGKWGRIERGVSERRIQFATQVFASHEERIADSIAELRELRRVHGPIVFNEAVRRLEARG